MKFSTFLQAFALASTAVAQFDVQSAPFKLVLLSECELNGTLLITCHEGAAIEGLCLGDKDGATPSINEVFQFNYSSENFDNKTYNIPGYVTWILPASNINVSSAFGLNYSPTSNVAIPLFFPGSDFATTVSFDMYEYLNVQGYIDDTKTPITGQGSTFVEYRWYICDTYWGYAYTTLAWVMGNGKPQNPTCTKVKVKRVFI
ncbi:hypothetical protein BP5796_11235 [Coleophoma crateriformis]|uniref:DUF7907 domain-containing protein n=1 Tax=Coleophoma crateriformis TaxID=565419 RepID=A0A3D8QHL8_9HELO|nr:hypothetical protein BP5796_11235 [Coleophoma crateriformis]